MKSCFSISVLITLCLSVILLNESFVELSSSGLVSSLNQFHRTENLEPVGVFGGKRISIRKANYIAVILFHKLKTFLGTAVILNNRWLITAAFNFNELTKNDVRIRVGSSFANKKGKQYKLSEIIIHPKYNGSWEYDIALAKLKIPLRFSKTVGKAKLSYSKLPKNGTTGNVIGYGWTKTTDGGFLQEASVPLLDYNSCKLHYTIYQISPLNFCTAKNGTGPCSKDIGSPLLYKDKVIGIFSGAYSCGSVEYPSVYADITKYNKWILSTIKRKIIVS